MNWETIPKTAASASHSWLPRRYFLFPIKSSRAFRSSRLIVFTWIERPRQSSWNSRADEWWHLSLTFFSAMQTVSLRHHSLGHLLAKYLDPMLEDPAYLGIGMVDIAVYNERPLFLSTSWIGIKIFVGWLSGGEILTNRDFLRRFWGTLERRPNQQVNVETRNRLGISCSNVRWSAESRPYLRHST